MPGWLDKLLGRARPRTPEQVLDLVRQRPTAESGQLVDRLAQVPIELPDAPTEDSVQRLLQGPQLDRRGALGMLRNAFTAATLPGRVSLLEAPGAVAPSILSPMEFLASHARRTGLSGVSLADSTIDELVGSGHKPSSVLRQAMEMDEDTVGGYRNLLDTFDNQHSPEFYLSTFDPRDKLTPTVRGLSQHGSYSIPFLNAETDVGRRLLSLHGMEDDTLLPPHVEGFLSGVNSLYRRSPGWVYNHTPTLSLVDPKIRSAVDELSQRYFDRSLNMSDDGLNQLMGDDRMFLDRENPPRSIRRWVNERSRSSDE